MTVEQRIERLASRIQKLNTVLDRYPTNFTQGAYEVGTTALTPETLRKSATAMAQQGRSLRVGIIGRVKAGKSSLLNALLFEGKDVLPKAATPMTASLTVLGYADTARAEVEFFEQKDINDMRKLAEDYDQEFKHLTTERFTREREKFNTRPTSIGNNRPVQEPDIKRIEASVRRELDANPVLGGAKDMYMRIQQAGGLPANAVSGKPQTITAQEGIEELLGKLSDYVGAHGKFTPFTKCLSIYLPLNALRDMEVVDTPGVNDPIVSRESRTYQELHRCDVVFVVSPSGQFLNQQDLELMGRLAGADGVEEVFLVASQIDSQMFSSEHKKHGGDLTRVLQGLREILAEQARNTLGARNQGSKGLDTLKHELSTRLVVTSSVAYVLATQPQSSWDANTRHVQQMLGKFYPAQFAQPNAALMHFDAIAGIKQTQDILGQVRTRKKSITEKKCDAFLDAQNKTLAQRLAQAPQAIEKNREQVKSADAESLEQKLQSIQKVSKQGVQATNAAVGTVGQNVADALRDHMDTEVTRLFDDLTGETERAQSTTTESRTVETKGFFGGAKRFFGWICKQDDWGTEERSETVSTINAATVRSALQKIHGELSSRLTRTVDTARKGLRPKLESSILRELREKQVVDDRDIDVTLLAQSCQMAMANLRDFDDPILPPLPDALLQSGVLKGSAAERYTSEATEYFQQLRRSAKAETRKLTKDFETRLNTAEIGTVLFEQYKERIQELKLQIKNKEEILAKYDQLLAEIKELQHHE